MRSIEAPKKGKPVLREKQKDLEQAYDLLERRVEERTAELSQSNALLKAEIAERQRAQEALKKSERYYRGLFENAHDAIILLDPESEVVLDANQRACDLYGYSRTEFVGLPMSEISRNPMNGSDGPPHSPENHSLEIVHYRKDGREMFLEINASVVGHDDTKAILSINRDITERKHNEEQLVRLGTAVEQSAENIIITDRTGVIEYVNPAFERMTGYTRQEAIGQTPSLIKSGKMTDEFYAQMWRTISNGEVWTGHFINRKKDGTLFEEEGSISPVRDATGQVVNYVAVKRNVTREKALEAQLRQAQKMEAIGRLAGGVAHDFNNLLTVIRGYSQIALARLGPDNPSSADLREVTKAADRATSLTRQLLAFSRRQVMQPTVLDLNAIVSDTEKMLRRLIGEDVQLVAIKEPALARIKADPGQIEQVLLNLAVNARDAMPGGGKLTITTANAFFGALDMPAGIAAQAGAYVVLSVRDTGHGMSPETLLHIFEPFFTTKEIGKGTGLGLATVYGIVQQSGGFIDVQSEVNGGTTFAVCLPQIQTTADHTTELEKRELPLGRETILLVEDEAAVRQLVGRVLRELGYNVLEAPNGLEALHLLKEREEQHIDLLLTDIVMPELNGKTLADLMRTLRPQARILLASGYTDDALAHHGALESGMAFLQKPFTPAGLAQKVREVLEA